MGTSILVVTSRIPIHIQTSEADSLHTSLPSLKYGWKSDRENSDGLGEVNMCLLSLSFSRHAPGQQPAAPMTLVKMLPPGLFQTR